LNPEHVQHYSSLGAIKSIIDTKSIWLSSVSSLNDTSEILYTKDKVLDELMGVLTKASTIDQAFRYIEALRPWVDLPPNHFVASFSKGEETLFHWLVYGDSAHGAAIVFKKALLVAAAAEQGFEAVECIYDPGAHSGECRAFAQSLVAEFGANNMLEIHPSIGSYEHSPWTEETERQSNFNARLRMRVVNFIHANGIRFKHRSFQGESELRLIGRKDYYDDSVAFRMRDQRTIVPYTTLDLTRLMQNKYAFQLHIGPNVSREPAHYSMYHIQKRAGGGGCFSSSIPPIRI
jgi:hypothetical protein